MAAVVIELPTAAMRPVVNPSRRGRYPRNIRSIRRDLPMRMARRTAADGAQNGETPHLQCGAPDTQTIAVLVDLIELARAGAVAGIAFAVQFADGKARGGSTESVRGDLTVAAVMQLALAVEERNK